MSIGCLETRWMMKVFAGFAAQHPDAVILTEPLLLILHQRGTAVPGCDPNGRIKYLSTPMNTRTHTHTDRELSDRHQRAYGRNPFGHCHVRALRVLENCIAIK